MNKIITLLFFTVALLAQFFVVQTTAYAKTKEYGRIPLEKQNNIQYGCEAYFSILGGKADINFCKCQNEYYRNLLTPADWERYSNDYFLLADLNQNPSNTPANSYARKVTLGQSHCAACKQKKYAGCFKPTDPIKTQEELVKLIVAGNFSKVNKNAHYSQVFVEYVSAYSAQCSHRISSGTRFTTTVYKDGVFDEQYEVLVETDLVDSFRKHRRISSDAMTAQSAATIARTMSQANPFDVTGIVKFGSTLAARAKRMEEQVKTNCDTQVGYTLHENFRRIELGLAPLSNDTSKQANKAFMDSINKGTQAEVDQRASIMVANKQAHTRAKQRWAERKAEAERVKPLNCTVERLDPNYQQISDKTRQALAPFRTYTGVWRGKFHGRSAELLTFSRSGRDLKGLIFFPDISCAMKLKFSSDKPFPLPVSYVRVSIHTAAMKTGYCTEQLGLPINANISAGFYLSPDSSKKTLRLEPSSASKVYTSTAELGFSSSCDTQIFKAARLSPEFKKLIEQEQAGWGRRIPYWIPSKQRWQAILQSQ